MEVTMLFVFRLVIRTQRSFCKVIIDYQNFHYLGRFAGI